MSKPPKPEAPAVDPLQQALAARAAQDEIAKAKETAQGDQASLVARYGTRLALAGGMSPLVALAAGTSTGLSAAGMPTSVPGVPARAGL